MSKPITIRHNKHYTSVLINTINKETILEASKLRNELPDEHCVVKPTKKAWQQFHELSCEEQLMRKTKVGDSFEILGVKFKVLKQKPDSRVNGNIELSYMNYHNWDGSSEEEIFGIFYEQSLLEFIYKNLTKGDLMFFQHL